MPSSVCQNVIYLVVSFSLRRDPRGFMNVAMGNIVLLTTKFLDVSKFTAVTPLSLPISFEFSFPGLG
jgi:hypothetical protein